MERAWKPNVEVSPHCPRCGSSNTKFCYYNNYSLTQPRYFCKGCRRYWTKGGSLRNVPVGGGCRKNRKNSKIFRSSSTNGFRGIAYSGVAHAPMMQHMGTSSTGNSAIEPTSSSTMSNGSNVDLALVFANFVNQKPGLSDTRRDYDKPELYSDSCHFRRGLEYSSLTDTNGGFNCTLSEDIEAYNGCPLYGQSKESQFLGIDQTFLSGLTSFQKHQHRIERHTTSYDGMIHLELPSWPGEEALQELMWSNSELMLNHGIPLPSSHKPVLDQDADLLIGNWSDPFDMSSKDDPFPKPL